MCVYIYIYRYAYVCIYIYRENLHLGFRHLGLIVFQGARLNGGTDSEGAQSPIFQRRSAAHISRMSSQLEGSWIWV